MRQQKGTLRSAKKDADLDAEKISLEQYVEDNHKGAT